MDDLYRPTLNRSPSKLYSSATTLVVTFLGGPIAAIYILGANSRALHTLRRDCCVYLMTLAMFVGVLVLVARTEDPSALLVGGYKIQTMVVTHGIALLSWSAIYMMHRRYLNVLDIMDVPARPPWRASIIAVVVGIALSVMATSAIIEFRE